MYNVPRGNRVLVRLPLAKRTMFILSALQFWQVGGVVKCMPQREYLFVAVSSPSPRRQLFSVPFPMTTKKIPTRHPARNQDPTLGIIW